MHNEVHSFEFYCIILINFVDSKRKAVYNVYAVGERKEAVFLGAEKAVANAGVASFSEAAKTGFSKNE